MTILNTQRSVDEYLDTYFVNYKNNIPELKRDLTELTELLVSIDSYYGPFTSSMIWDKLSGIGSENIYLPNLSDVADRIRQLSNDLNGWVIVYFDEPKCVESFNDLELMGESIFVPMEEWLKIHKNGFQYVSFSNPFYIKNWSTDSTPPGKTYSFDYSDLSGT